MISDEDLITAWRNGDNAAGEKLCNIHFDSIYRFFRNKVGAIECNDLTQKTFMAFLESRGRFAGRSSVRTWLFGIARNVLSNFLSQRRRTAPPRPLDDESMADYVSDELPFLDHRPELRLLLRALRRLPIKMQVTLELYYWEELTMAEIAETLQEPLGTISTRLKRGRERLDAMIAELAESPSQCESTLHSFSRWAKGLRRG